MSMTYRPPPPPAVALLAAVRRLLRPLVRLMIDSGVTFPLVADVLRRLFVEVAVTDILIQPKARSDSRVSLLTGVHRKEIRRLRQPQPEPSTEPRLVTISSQIIARWLAAEPYADAGRPRPLLRAAEPGVAEPGVAEPSFEALVASVTTDIRPRAVLDDWLNQGFVQIDSANRVELNVDAFIPRRGGEEQLFYFARNLHDHVAAAVANITAAKAAPFLDRSVHYDALTAAQARELEAYARGAAVRVLLDVNRKALELVGGTAIDPAARAARSATRRLNFGVFVFGANDDCDDEAGRDTAQGLMRDTATGAA